MNIAICDDDKNCVNKIMQLIQEYDKSENFNLYTFSSGEEFLKGLDDKIKIDIIFLDIEMLEVSGIDVARYLRKKDNKVLIIFVTNHVNYVSDTFRLGAFQFLIKPIDEEAFKYDFERAIRTYKNTHTLYQIRWRNINYILEYGEIYYIEAYNRHLYIHTTDMKYECVGKLVEEEKKLSAYNFVRCHQGFLVNMYKIKEINKSYVILNNDAKIPIGRRYREELLEKFNLFLAGRLV